MKTGLLEKLALKYGVPVSELKRKIMKTAIQKAKVYKAQGLPWREALRRALKETWSEIRAGAFAYA